MRIKKRIKLKVMERKLKRYGQVRRVTPSRWPETVLNRIPAGRGRREKTGVVRRK